MALLRAVSTSHNNAHLHALTGEERHAPVQSQSALVTQPRLFFPHQSTQCDLCGPVPPRPPTRGGGIITSLTESLRANNYRSIIHPLPRPFSPTSAAAAAETLDGATAGRNRETWSPSQKPSCIVQGEVYITESKRGSGAVCPACREPSLIMVRVFAYQSSPAAVASKQKSPSHANGLFMSRRTHGLVPPTRRLVPNPSRRKAPLCCALRTEIPNLLLFSPPSQACKQP